MHKHLLAVASLLTMIAGNASAQTRDLSSSVELTIAAQSLTSALLEFSAQTGMQVVTAGADVRHLNTAGISGRTTVGEALEKLLAGSGLSFKLMGENTVGLLRAPVLSSASPDGVTREDPSIRLAEAEPMKQVAGQEEADKVSSPDAQMSQNSETKVQEIIVTAQKRAQNLQDVPISMTVLGGEYLDRFTQRGVLDALALTPGLTIDQGLVNGGNQVSLRGVGAAGSFYAGSGPVAFYIDGVPFGFVKSAFVPDMSPYDMDRIEVLRGPQGTLYGASALAGVTRVLTHEPDLGRFEAKARTSLATTKDGSESYRGDLAVNVPLIEDKLAVRAVVGYGHTGGWIDRPNLNEKDGNDQDVGYLRVRLKAKPTERLGMGLSAWISRGETGASHIADPREQFPGVNDTSTYEDFNVYSLSIDYDFRSFSLTSATSYIDYAARASFDYRPLVPFLGDLVTNPSNEVFTQEVTLHSASEGQWRWALGGFYRDAEDLLLQSGAYLGGVVIDYSDMSKSFAAFGEMTRIFFSGAVELTGGVRYFEDKVNQIENAPFDGNQARPRENVSDTFKHFSPRALLSWYPSDNTTYYLSYGQGFRSGANQQALVTLVAPTLPSAKEDTLTNYELGTKGNLFDGRISYDVALYYMDWQDVQQQIFVDARGNFPCNSGACFYTLVNGISASGLGFDIGLDFHITDRLSLAPTFSRNELTWDEDVPGLFEKGGRPPYSVAYTVGGSASYRVPLGVAGLEGMLTVGAQHSPAPDAVALGTAEDKLMINAGFSIMADHWTAHLYADNVSDERQTSAGFPGIGNAINNYNIRQRPRTIGVQFEYSY